MNESNIPLGFGPNLLEILEKLTGQSALPPGVQIIASGSNIVAINPEGQMLIASGGHVIALENELANRSNQEIIYTVDPKSLTTKIIETNPPKLQIMASGTTRSSGWTKATLSPRYYFVAPLDGIWEFDLVAEKPNGPAANVISPISLNHPFEIKGGFSTWKGIRIIAESNSAEIRLN